VQITLDPLVVVDKHPLVNTNVNGVSNEILIKEKTVIDCVMDQIYNTIDITFVNKVPKDTKVDKEGIITQDLAVIIKSITYRTFDFIPYLEDIAKYTKVDGSDAGHTHGFMGFAGTLSISLKSPLFVLAKELSIYKSDPEESKFRLDI
jgi:hypothetical protein